MNKNAFIKELSKRLRYIPKEDREDAVEYYTELMTAVNGGRFLQIFRQSLIAGFQQVGAERGHQAGEHQAGYCIQQTKLGNHQVLRNDKDL